MSLVLIPVGSAYGLNIKPSQTALWYFYEVGTTTPKDTFPTSAETPGTAHTNPVVSDENGVFPLIYTSGLYKAQITDLYGANINGPWDNLQGRDGDLIDQGIFDSTTNGGDYPASGSKGDQYDVIETFDLNATSGGHSVFDGDRIQANKNGATGIDADWDIILGKNSRQKVVDISSKNLVFSNLASGSEDVDADSINLVNSSNQVKQITDINDAYVPGDLDVGTMKASHWYHKWIDEDKTLKLSVELTGTSGTASAGFLVWASGTALTDGVKAGDIVYNTEPGEGTKTTVSVTPTVDGDPIALTADIFNTGDTFRIHKLSPAGLGNYKADLGAVYNNAAGNFDDSRKNGQARITKAFWNTIDGYGSSSTKIQKFTTEVVASDDVVVTVENSSTLGFTITANMDCDLSVYFDPAYSTGAQCGISKNSSQLTTNIGSITEASRLVMAYTPAADQSATVGWSGVIKDRDVIRLHCAGTTDGSNPQQSAVHVKAVEII